MVAFTANPVMFRINNLNGQRIDSTTNISAVIGKAFHRAMEVYYLLAKQGQPESDAMASALEQGIEYMDAYPEGWIRWSDGVSTREAAQQRLSFAITSYLTQSKYVAEETIEVEDEITERIDVEWNGARVDMPVPIKGIIDRVVRRADGKLAVRDYKTCATFSKPDKIDGKKMLQAVVYFFLVWKKYGEKPYSMTYEEVKTTKNKDGSPQVREYEIVYDDHPLYFRFFFRLYADIIRGVNGEQVYPPNLHALYDNEVAIIAYIQCLDVPDEVAKRMEANGVSGINDLLRKDIEQAGVMRRVLKEVEGDLAQCKTIDYASMQEEKRITTKMLEHGIKLSFDSMIEGSSVRLYRFNVGLGVKMSRLRQYADDIQQVLGTTNVRILAPIPGSTLIGVEVPRVDRQFPGMPESDGFNLAIGERVDGSICRFDLRDAPHMLVAGSSGSGKSVFLHALIGQLKEAGAEVVPIDPKRVEFARYPGCISDIKAITATLDKLVSEMESRYARLEEAGQRDARAAGWEPIVVVIDEYADLTMHAKSEVPNLVQRLAQKGRAAGIHMVVATQRASTDVITGTIKVNFPVKAVFRMAKEIDSCVMIDERGAEKLLGHGDMLFASDAGIERLQGFLCV